MGAPTWPPTPQRSGRPGEAVSPLDRALGLARDQATLEQFVLEVERAGAGGLAVGDGPEELELEAVGILGVEREAGAVVRLAHERARLDQPLAGAREIGQLGHFPRRVVHARHALVGRTQSRLLEEAQVVIVAAARDREERGVGIATLHLEAQHVAVEAHAALDVTHPQHEMLQALEAEAAHPLPSGYSMLTVIDAQAISVSEPGTRRPPATGVTVTSPCGSSLRTRSTSTEAGSGTPTVTATSILPPRSRASANSGRLEWRMASGTPPQARLVQSRPRAAQP